MEGGEALEKTDINARLTAFQARLDKAEQQLKIRDKATADRKKTIQDFRRRYKIISDRVNKEVDDQTKQGRHVTDLEKSLRLWLNGLDFDMS